jgi:hypothetical protein
MIDERSLFAQFNKRAKPVARLVMAVADARPYNIARGDAQLWPWPQHMSGGGGAMPTSTLTVNLSQTLQGTLGKAGTYAWAVLYDQANGNNAVSTTPLVINGAIQSSGAITVNLPPTVNGGKLYLIVQSVDPNQQDQGAIPPLTFGPSGIITGQSAISWDTAQTNDFRYDSFEFSTLGLAGDAANLTDVTGFGLPMSVSISYPNGTSTQTRGYAVNGSSIFSQITSNVGSSVVSTYSQGPQSGNDRLAASPVTALTTSGITGPSASDWNAYVQSIGASAGTLNIRVGGFFNGAPSVDWTTYNGTNYSYLEFHNAGFYSYSLTFQKGTGNTGTYVFTPASNSQIQGTIQITTQDLANSIYATLGNAQIVNPDGSDYQFSSLSNGQVVTNSNMNTGSNNQWGAFFVKFLTGFIGDYLGGTATPQNSLLGTTKINLSNDWNFDPTFAFGGKIPAGQPGAVTPWTWSTNTYGNGVSYDKYANIFFNNTNSYGNGYSDALMNLYQQADR